MHGSVHILSNFRSNCHFGYKYLPKCVKNLAATISPAQHVSLFLSQHMLVLHNIMSRTFGEPSELHENLIAHTGAMDEKIQSFLCEANDRFKSSETN